MYGPQAPFNTGYYPPQPPFMVPMPANYKEYKDHLKMLRKARSFYKEIEDEHKKKDDGKKKEEKKPNFSVAQITAMLVIASPILGPAYALACLAIIRKVAESLH